MDIITRIQKRSVELEGTITGEHGVGLGLRDMLVQEVGEEAVGMMRRVCCVFFLEGEAIHLFLAFH